MIDLPAHAVRTSSDEPEVFYIADFVSEDEEAHLLRKISESPQQKWKALPNRRLQIWGGELTAKNRLIAQPLPDFVTKFPDVVGRIHDLGVFDTSPHKCPNHIILNEYLPGQGIMPHEDGPSYHPVVATLSLGSHAVFHYYRYKDSSPVSLADGAGSGAPPMQSQGRPIDPVPIMSMLLEPRSLVITTGELYSGRLHGIEDVHEDVFSATSPSINNVDLLGDASLREVVLNGGTLKRAPRYSLTCRDVEHVVNAARFIGRR